MVKVVEVRGGKFYCESCGQSFIGTWHGRPGDKMFCPFCKKPLEVKEANASG